MIASTIILISIFVVATSPNVNAQDYSYLLNAKCQAIICGDGSTNLELSLSGTATGGLTSYMYLSIESGPNSYLDVSGVGKFPIIGGRGLLIQSYHYLSLTIYLIPPDGGPSSYCRLQGTTGELDYNNYLGE